MVWELIKSLIFGIVEGITEWLPISSTGHLILLDEFLKLDASDNFKEMFDVVIQLGAILAVVVIYWNKLWPFGKQNNPHPMAQTGFGACLKKDILQMWCKVIVATVPAAVIGLLLDDWSQAHLYNAWTVAIMLILFGIAFIWIEKWHKNRTPKMNSIASLKYSTVLLIGVFQLSNISGNLPFRCDHRRRTAAGRVQNSCGRVHLFPGDSGDVRRKPAETGEVRTPGYRYGDCTSADRHDLRIPGIYRRHPFPDELYQET